MKKVLGGILLVVYSIIAITVTVLLLSYNDYNCSEIGGYTIYIVNDDSLEPEYKQGSILLVKHTSDKNVQSGDKMFLYKVINSQEYEFVEKTLDKKVQQGNHTIYVVEDEENYDNSYFVGKTSDTAVIEGWGYVLSLLESKWGYLFCVVIVSLLLFLQEVFELAMEIKYGREVKKARQASTSTKIAEKVETEENEESQSTKNVAKKTTNKPRTNNTAKTNTTKIHIVDSKASTGKTANGAKKSNTAKTEGTAHKTTSKGAKTASKKVGKEEKANSEE